MIVDSKEVLTDDINKVNTLITKKIISDNKELEQKFDKKLDSFKSMQKIDKDIFMKSYLEFENEFKNMQQEVTKRLEGLYNSIVEINEFELKYIKDDMNHIFDKLNKFQNLPINPIQENKVIPEQISEEPIVNNIQETKIQSEVGLSKIPPNITFQRRMTKIEPRLAWDSNMLKQITNTRQEDIIKEESKLSKQYDEQKSHMHEIDQRLEDEIKSIKELSQSFVDQNFEKKMQGFMTT